jgi:Bifunctional DNA primase/polymerase, N-terminal/Primase C terminal 2 (PriCT-2)
MIKTTKANDTVLAAALTYATTRGWAVFPARFVQVGNKWEKKSWKSAKSSNGRAWGMTKDPDELRRDFTKTSRSAIGIPTGAVNGIVVIEADTPEGHNVDGLASLKQLEAKHGALPETLTGESPTGSLHRYYNHPGNGAEVRCTTSELGPGIDVKGDGGMVIAPPSLRPGKGSYRWVNEAPIADAPDWLTALITAEPAAVKPESNAGRQAPLWKVAAALAAIPNPPELYYGEWKRIGMAVWAATGGSDDGFKTFDDWSRKWVKYDADHTRKAWQEISRSPPTEIGAGTLFYEANQASLGWHRRYYPGNDGPVALGFTKDGNFALRDRVRNLIISASAGQLTSHQWLLGLMPSEFWIERFLSVKKDNVWFNQFKAGEALMAACRCAGPFDPLQVRGRGVWREGDKTIINLGDPIPSTTKYHYICFAPIRFDPVASFEVQRLLELLRLFPWKNPPDAVLLLGWAALAPICGVLLWRPHGFIYGPKETGKTTLHTLLKHLLSPLVISTEGGSSEAGIRQTLGPDSRPILIDEFENDHDGGALRRVLRLIRSASSADNPVLRGTPEGRAMQFSLCTTFLLCAVNTTGMSPADQSRILLLELTKHNNELVTAQMIAAEEAYFRDLGPRWCGYMIALAGLMQPALSAFQLKMPIADRHYRQNFATILAAAFIALHGRAPTADEVSQWIADYAPTMERHAEDSARDNAIECFEHLQAYIVERYSLGRWIATAILDPPAEDTNYRAADAARITQTYGITVKDVKGDKFVVIRNRSPNIEAAFRTTVWAEGGWQRALRGLEGATNPENPVRFSERDKSRGVGIPLSYFSDDEPVPGSGSGFPGGPNF